MGVPDVQAEFGEAEIRAKVGQVLERGGAEFDTRHRRKDGEMREVHVSTRALKLAGTWRILGIWTDLTGQKRAQQEMEQERTRYQQILRTARDGIHILDGDGNLIEANAAFLDSLGYSPQEAVGLNVRDWDAHFTAEELARKTPTAIGGGETFETTHRRRDGTLIDVEISARTIELDGKQYLYNSARDITGRKRAEEARRASEARFRDLAMMSADWMWEQDDQFRFTYVSDGYYAKTGMTPEETLGKTRWEISHLGVSEADWRAHRVALERHEVFADFVHRRPTPDGEIRWLTTTGKPIFGADGTFRGYRGVGRDVTELHRHLDELAASEARWQFAIEGKGDGLWDWNTKDKRIFLSPRCREIIGFEHVPETEVFDRWAMCVHPDDRSAVQEEFRRCLHGDTESFLISYRILDYQNAVKWLAVRGMTLVRDEERRALRIIGTVRDVTEIKRSEERERKRDEERIHAGRVAMLGEMATTLSHELNQPLTSIGAYAATAERYVAHGKLDTRKLIEILSDINVQAHRAGDIIRHVRELVKKQPPQARPIDINHLVGSVCHFMSMQARMADIAIEQHLEPRLLPVCGDRVQLEQVLINLVKNALEALDQFAQEHRVRIATGMTADGQVSVSVRDWGPGIPAELREQIFEPFFTTKPDGTGLGLGISRTIVEAHGGHLRMEANAGGGATFWFELPVAQI
jgi:hypothetical protein